MFGVSSAQAASRMDCDSHPGALDRTPSDKPDPANVSRASTASSPRESSAPARSCPMSTKGATAHRGASSGCALPCDPDPDTTPAGDRSWCIHPPYDGVTPRGADVSTSIAPVPHAVPAKASVVPAPPSRPVARARRHAPNPVVALPHAPPQSRAPPVGVPTDLF